MSRATRKDFHLVSIAGFLTGLFFLLILENVKPSFWELSLYSFLALVLSFVFSFNILLWLGGILGEKYLWFWQFTKYGAVGAMSASINFGIVNIFSLATKIFAGPFLVSVNVLAFFVAVSNGYFWHRFWSFKKNSAPHIGEYSKFFGITVMSAFLIDSLLVYLLTTVLGAPDGFSPALWENITKVIAIIPIVFINFSGYKFLVFKNDKTIAS